MTDSEILRVVEAHIEGQKIQCNYKKRAGIDWWDVKCPNWDFSEYDFRVAPEPRKPREWNVVVQKGNFICSTGFACGDEQIRVREVIE